MSVLNEEESWFLFHISEEFRVLRSVIWHKMMTTKDGDNEDDDILRWQYRWRCIAVTYHALLCSTILNYTIALLFNASLTMLKQGDLSWAKHWELKPAC